MPARGTVKAGRAFQGTAAFAESCALLWRLPSMSKLTAGSVLLGHIAAQEPSCLFLGMWSA